VLSLRLDGKRQSSHRKKEKRMKRCCEEEIKPWLKELRLERLNKKEKAKSIFKICKEVLHEEF